MKAVRGLFSSEVPLASFGRLSFDLSLLVRGPGSATMASQVIRVIRMMDERILVSNLAFEDSVKFHGPT